MDLLQALRIDPSTRLALVGSGGKTTALFQLAQLIPGPVLVTASTHLAVDQVHLADRHWVLEQPGDLSRYRDEILNTRVALLTGPVAEAGRVGGLAEELLDDVSKFANSSQRPVLIEADGSRRLPLKAPASYEPAIPHWANLVIVVVGLSGIGQPLSEESVHRPQIFSALSHVDIGQIITFDALKEYLLHPLGGLKNIPPGARKVVLLNQADNQALVEAGSQISHDLKAEYDAVITASLAKSIIHQVAEPAAGIILAAGGAQRFGRQKVLLDWHGKPFVRHAAETALRSGLSPILVVAGGDELLIREALSGLPVQIVPNPAWANGQSTSLKAGIQALPRQVGSAVFLLADQPQIPASIIRSLVQAHEKSLSAVIAPRVKGLRGNPVLFDRITFPDLLSVTGDTGGRAIFGKYPVQWIESDDPRLLIDIDTPEDYERLKALPEDFE